MPRPVDVPVLRIFVFAGRGGSPLFKGDRPRKVDRPHGYPALMGIVVDRLQASAQIVRSVDVVKGLPLSAAVQYRFVEATILFLAHVDPLPGLPPYVGCRLLGFLRGIGIMVPFAGIDETAVPADKGEPVVDMAFGFGVFVAGLQRFAPDAFGRTHHPSAPMPQRTRCVFGARRANRGISVAFERNVTILPHLTGNRRFVTRQQTRDFRRRLIVSQSLRDHFSFGKIQLLAFVFAHVICPPFIWVARGNYII